MMNNIQVITDGAYTKFVYSLAQNETILSFPEGMLSNNSIKGVAGYSISYEQGVTRLIYTIGRGTSLAALLRQNMPKRMVLAMFNSILSVIGTAQDYMLDAEGFLLDSRYVFVDTANMSATMIYIPTNVRCGISLNQFMKSCMFQGVFDLSEDGTYPAKIQNYLNTHDNVSAADMRRLIDSLMNNTAPMPAGGFQPRPQPVTLPNQNPRPVQVQMNQPPQMNPQMKQPGAPAVNPQMKQPGPAAQQPQAPAMNIPQPQPAAKPQEKPKLSLFHKDKKSEQKPQPQPQQNNSAPGFGGIAIPGVNAPMGGGQPVQQPAAPQNNAPKPAPAPAPQPAPQAKPAAPQPQGGVPIPACLIDKNGKRIPINGSTFWIGRSKQSEIHNSLIIEENLGVGKNHAVIEFVNGKFFITDNESRNGTFINGNRINPRVRTELRSGCRIALWNEVFTFQIG